MRCVDRVMHVRRHSAASLSLQAMRTVRFFAVFGQCPICARKQREQWFGQQLEWRFLVCAAHWK